jgi:pimeloyl-ACP methyl ester carboxylesterase
VKRQVRANGVDLCVETFGDRNAPGILLIAGAANSMDWWEDEFCERLAAGQRFVIRYDLRDTGQSVLYPPGRPDYSGRDLVADAAGVLDVLGVSGAHIVGISMGGGIGQLLALGTPTRVASLTLVSTSPAVPLDDGPLPARTKELAAIFAQPPAEPDWSDRDAVVEYIVHSLRPFAGSVTIDEARSRALVETVVDRTVDIEASLKNHWLLDDAEPMQGRLDAIAARTLVLHGTEDPFLPYGHGEALAAAIPDARLVPLTGVGHEFPPPQTWDIVVAAILDHTERR